MLLQREAPALPTPAAHPLESFLSRLIEPSEARAIAAEHQQLSFTEVEAYYERCVGNTTPPPLWR